MTQAIIQGTPPGHLAALPRALAQAGIGPAATTQADILINVGEDPEAAIAAAEAFAASAPADRETLVINVLHAHAGGWPAARAHALLWAHTRHAALAWAPRGIRVNALAFGTIPHAPDQPLESAGQAAFAAPAAPATMADIAATICLFWRLRSMTGQIIRLGMPRQAPPGSPP